VAAAWAAWTSNPSDQIGFKSEGRGAGRALFSMRDPGYIPLCQEAIVIVHLPAHMDKAAFLA
jgi:hypothetical protein